ncbi:MULTISPECIES: hypothetical protein [Flavobacterium]|uniref:Uncharacterized protein n=1 Tax=Flavobacterium collinsii TaxID=1114861 RepID=A0A9W4TCN9_9FLAO|nr:MULTISPECIES: hypothetical protein [Flavobacterium]GIQ58679.1 hypothetical protein Flavo103_18150 [Flavobacterium collinsii]CAI2765499.1 conserved protein of unknown function [Flavobacterium collinsii]
MGFLDLLDLLNNASKAGKTQNLTKNYVEKFTDKNEYVGERIKYFIGFLFITLFLIVLGLGIIFLIFKTLKQS